MEDKAMHNTEIILEQYREADFERRLNLFLECPAFRNRFIEIDQSESSGNSSLEVPRKDVAGCELDCG
jgi:hypothetical protein